MANLPLTNAAGDLPPGIHQASLTEVTQRFGEGPARRQSIADRLRRIYALASETGHLARFIVFGSFITSEPAPNDVDVFLLMEDSFDADRLRGEAAILFNHPWAQACSGFAGSRRWAASNLRPSTGRSSGTALAVALLR